MNQQYEDYPLTPQLRASIDHGNAAILFPRLNGSR